MADQNSAVPFRNILAPTDFSEHAAGALGRAVALAEKTGASVTVAHVIPDEVVAASVPGTSFATHWEIPTADLKQAEKKLVEEAMQRLIHWIEPFKKAGRGPLNAEVLVGVPFVEIIRAVTRNRHDLVVAGTRGLGAVGRLLVGSTAERLVRKCPCPVWIVHPQHEWPLRSILVPVDLSPVSAQCLETAAELARESACTVTALHVFNLPAVAVPAPVTVPPPAEESTDRRAGRQAAAKRLDAFVHACQVAGVAVQQQLAVGVPWRAIVRIADRIDASLIVMGSAARSGIPGFLIGNTAEKVLRQCKRSILTRKPDGFVTPVQ